MEALFLPHAKFLSASAIAQSMGEAQRPAPRRLSPIPERMRQRISGTRTFSQSSCEMNVSENDAISSEASLAASDISDHDHDPAQMTQNRLQLLHLERKDVDETTTSPEAPKEDDKNILDAEMDRCIKDWREYPFCLCTAADKRPFRCDGCEVTLQTWISQTAAWREKEPPIHEWDWLI